MCTLHLGDPNVVGVDCPELQALANQHGLRGTLRIEIINDPKNEFRYWLDTKTNATIITVDIEGLSASALAYWLARGIRDSIGYQYKKFGSESFVYLFGLAAQSAWIAITFGAIAYIALAMPIIQLAILALVVYIFNFSLREPEGIFDQRHAITERYAQKHYWKYLWIAGPIRQAYNQHRPA